MQHVGLRLITWERPRTIRRDRQESCLYGCRFLRSPTVSILARGLALASGLASNKLARTHTLMGISSEWKIGPAFKFFNRGTGP